MTLDDFLAGIIAQPAELDRWLILADWLEDHGDARAELARLHYALHADPATDRPERLARRQALLDAGLRPVVPTWTGPAGSSSRCSCLVPLRWVAHRVRTGTMTMRRPIKSR